MSEATPSSSSRAQPLTILTASPIEAAAVRRGAPWATVHSVGPGDRRAASAVHGLGSHVLFTGFCHALDDELNPGDVVLARQIRHAEGTISCADPTVLASVLRSRGATVATGPVFSLPGLRAGGSLRRRGVTSGSVAADLGAAAKVARLADASTLTVMCVVLGTPRGELRRPGSAAQASLAAWRELRRASSSLGEWVRCLAPREIALAAPRASCAGVERAVQVVERALEDRKPPVYVRKQIVHNAHVIADLERKGAIFVDEVDEVPSGATVIFSAHGVSPAVRAQARERGLDVIDATCPLVAKVHAEARRFSADNFEIVLVGHEGHEEVEGTYGEAPARMHVVASEEEAEKLELDPSARVAYLTQTTLAVDDTAAIVSTLRRRFENLRGPRSSDICYATQNRQDAVRALASDCDLILVIGSQNSSNSRRLVEVAQRAGAPAALIEDGSALTPELLSGVRRIGVTAGASAPESLVADLIAALAGLGTLTISERSIGTEDVEFKLPAELRARR
jgi:4-hydroxy-3-methylbut-2-enyl diphosphate reductase